MEKRGPVFPCFSVFLFLAALLLPGVWAASAGAPEVSVFATPEQCGQILSLTTDDEGRLYAAVTERAFGRGTVSAMGNAAMAAQDRAVRSTAEREQLVTGWLGAGKLVPLLKARAAFFSPGGGPLDFLTKYSESVHWLTDVNHDGKAETSMLVAESFRDPADGPGSTLLALPNGRWLYGCAPNLWQLEDRNDDQRAEERSSQAEGFGLSNEPWGADLHALREAPDGWIYWARGGRGYAVRTSSGGMVRGMGSGAIFRCRPDGSSMERVARGLHNPRALAMKPDGQLLAVDEVVPGGKTRLLLILPEADYGWQAAAVSGPGAGLWFEEGMEAAALGDAPGPDTPQWMVPPLTRLDDPCAALEILPDGTFLAAGPQGGGKGGLSTWALEEAEPSWQIKLGQRYWQGGAVTALTQSPDGSLYFTDWGEKVDAAGRSQVRRLTWRAPPPASPEAESAITTIQRLPELTVRELKGLLAHPSPRVALRARQRLEGMSFQDSLEALLQVARRGPTLASRLHGLRGAGAIARQDAALLNELTAFLSDPEPAIRATAATLWGEGSLREASAALRRALTDESRVVRLAAAAAIARLKPPGILATLLQAAAGESARHPLDRASLANAMAEAVPAPALMAAAREHPMATARLTTVIALRRTAGLEVAEFLLDSDPATAAEAARAIYDLPLRPAFPRLAALLDDPNRPSAVLRRALAAAVYLGTPEAAGHVAALATAPGCPPQLAAAALAALKTWDRVPVVDPLWNRPEAGLPRPPGTARAAAHKAAEGLRSHPDQLLADQALKVWDATAPPSAAARLTTVNDPNAPEPERLTAFLSLVATNELSTDAAKVLTNPASAGIPPSLRSEARSLLMRRDPKAAVPLLGEALSGGSLAEKQAAVRTLEHLPGNGGDNEKAVLELVKRLGFGTIEPGLQVEVLEALQRRDFQSRSPWRRATEAWLASLSTNVDPLAAWRMTVEGGDADAGRVIFETHPEANCLSCHATGGIGGLKGPDLDGVADRLDNSALLQSLIQPSDKIAKGYAALPGQTMAGGGAAEQASIMPPMGTLLTLREIRDLMAYLRSLKTP